MSELTHGVFDTRPNPKVDISPPNERQSLRDAQATVEALQARVKECDAVIEKQVAILEEINKLDAERAAFVVDLKAQLTQRTAELEALQRERDEAIREHGKESGFWGRSCARLLDKRDELQAALDAERESNRLARRQIEAVDMERAELQQQLSQLKALVRALPIYEADALITVDGDLDEIDRPALRSAVMELLAYRATLDATTPAGEDEGGTK